MATKKAKKVATAAPTQVAMILNGNSVGMVDPAGKSVGQVAQDIAREHGLKTYSVLVDGIKILAEGAAAPLQGHATGAAAPLQGHATIEVFAKETRG